MKEFLFIPAIALMILVSGCVSDTAAPVTCSEDDTVMQNDLIKVQYRGTLDDGTLFDDGELEFRANAGQMIKGFDNAVEGMCVGDEKNVRIEAADAYGESDPSQIQTVPGTFVVMKAFEVTNDAFVERFGVEPEAGKEHTDETLIFPLIVKEVADNVTLENQASVGDTFTEPNLWGVTVTEANETHFTVRRDPVDGQTVMTYIGARTVSVRDGVISIDFNHPLAGKALNFYIKVLSVTRS